MTDAQRTMIFHTPYPLDPDAKSASGIRPVRMRRAFEAVGYRVVEVTGPAAERKRSMAALRSRIRAGGRFDFVYSEASTMPTALTESHHLPTHPRLDLDFLAFCRRSGIPVGLFYRDIYWNEPEYLERVNRLVAAGTRAFYRSDLRRYRSAVTRLFVPSLDMAKVMPYTDVARCIALPPGSDPVDSSAPGSGVSLFYVGGTGGYYRMQETVRGVEAVDGARLTLCTREGEWAESSPLYADVLGPATTIVHRSGAELEPLYDDAHIGSLLMEPIGYREFAAPMKLYEYLGHGKPVIATAGSLAGEFVEANGIGWAIPYDADALSALLRHLVAEPAELSAAVERTREVREQHTWEARARQVASDLMGAADN